jgi:hypothetical protein
MFATKIFVILFIIKVKINFSALSFGFYGKLRANVLQLGEVADLEALNFNLALMFI